MKDSEAPASLPLALRVATGRGTPVMELAAAVRVARQALADPRGPHLAEINGQLVAMLHAATERAAAGLEGAVPAAPAVAAEVIAAVRVACAYLAARNLPEARLALRTAEDDLTTTMASGWAR